MGFSLEPQNVEKQVALPVGVEVINSTAYPKWFCHYYLICKEFCAWAAGL